MTKAHPFIFHNSYKISSYIAKYYYMISLSFNVIQRGRKTKDFNKEF